MMGRMLLQFLFLFQLLLILFHRPGGGGRGLKRRELLIKVLVKGAALDQAGVWFAQLVAVEAEKDSFDLFHERVDP